MNYYAMETQMFERHHEMVRKAEARRLTAVEDERPEAEARQARAGGFFATVGETLRALRPRLGGA